jgi:hypothetical protein
MIKNFFSAALLLAVGLVSAAEADVFIDGTLDGSYALDAIQTIETGFGDNQNELDAAYSYFANGKLYVMVTGNLQQSFNKLEIFFDTQSGIGENIMSSTPTYDFFGQSQNLGGMQFDPAFTANYHMYARGGNPGDGSGDIFDVDFVDRDGGTSVSLNSNGARAVFDIGTQTASGVINQGDFSTFGNSAGDAIAKSIEFGFNNTNVAGIGGATGNPADQTAAQAVTTGFEFSIALSDLGLDPNDPNTIRIAMMLNNNEHNFLSNQTLGGLPVGFGNLAAPSTVNFANFNGDQYYSITLHTIPEPSTSTILVLAGMGYITRRRRG